MTPDLDGSHCRCFECHDSSQSFRDLNRAGSLLCQAAYADPVELRTPNAAHIILELADRENNGCEGANDTNSPDQELAMHAFPIL